MQTQDGHTPLMFSVMYGYAIDDVVRALLAHGAHVNARTANGTTALMLACGFGSERVRADTIGLILEAGADPNAQTNFGYTALMYAKHRKDIPGLLLRKGADPNVRSDVGDTALLLAVADRNVEAVKALLQSGADVRVEPDSEGLTLSDWFEQLCATDDDFAEAEKVSVNGRAAVRLKSRDDGGEQDCFFFAAGGILGICLETTEPDLPQDVAAESQRTFQRMLRSFETLP